MDSAVPPAASPVFNTFRKIIEPKSEIEIATEDQNQIAALSGDPRWEAYKKEFEKEIENINKMQGDDLQGLDVTTIGYKYLACRAIIAKLTEMMLRPDAYAQTIREAGTKSEE